MLGFRPIPRVIRHFSGNFFRNLNISRQNYAVGAKKLRKMHKLSRKSSELIPPAQHPVCSALLNKFIFFFSSSYEKLKEVKRSCIEREKNIALKKKENKVLIHAACLSNRARRMEIFCERSIIVYWEIYSGSIIKQLFYFYATFSLLIIEYNKKIVLSSFAGNIVNCSRACFFLHQPALFKRWHH